MINNTLKETEARNKTSPVTSDRANPERIHWEQGIEGLALCWIGYSLLFPLSPFFGLSLLGIGVLMVGLAFGRD